MARFGGVEFAVLLPDSGPEGAAVTARELLLALEQPFAVGDYNISLEANIGIAVYPDHGADAGTLIRNADAAVSEAARTGSRYAIYTPEAEAPAQAVAGGY
ncbi:MAG TPA: GGDEF domain-containing protein [Dehalococcoidia bacterium]